MSKPGNQSVGESGELLRAKLTPPRLRGPLMERELLFARLDEGLEQRVILLSAPAGSGKTTLVRAWLANRARNADWPAVAWVSLDAGENDPVRFWRYVLTACSALRPELGRQALEMLSRSPQSFESALTVFLNELALLPGRGILVLEDYHAINSPRVHEMLTFLLDYVPETLRVVVITRGDPPLPLARWRAHDKLCELRAADLRFTLEETQCFLRQAIPFPFTSETIASLDERVEGWAAGLRLLALALQGRRNPREIERALATFSGSHQHILEYLVADVLNAQPQYLQSFLLQTSLLTRLTGPLCDALTGHQDGTHILGQLDQANLFLYPLDAAGQWYRYHALFAEAMQHEARGRLGEERWHELHARASLWYEAHNQPLEAIETALAARDFVRAADLMEGQIDPQVFQNEYYTLLRYAEKLPEEQLATRPALCMIYATGLLYLTDRHAPATLALVERPLQMAERIWQAEGNTARLGEIEALRSSTFWWRGDFERSFQLAGRALELLPVEASLWRGTCLINLGAARIFSGQLDQAHQIFLEALQANQAAGNGYGARASQFLHCEVCLFRGELHLAAQIYQQLFAEAEASRDFADVGSACWGLSLLAYEWNTLETASEGATQALDVARRFSDIDLLVRASLPLARLQHLRGETSQALRDLTALAAQTQLWPYLLRDIHVCQARLALASGDPVTARQQISLSAQYSSSTNFPHQQELALLNARLLIARGEIDEALPLLSFRQAEAGARGFTRAFLEILVLQARAHHARKETSLAREALLQALTLARPEGYQRLFLDEGRVMDELLRSVLPTLHDEQLAAYVRELLHAFIHEQATRSDAEPLLIEPLSAQERRVLRLLAAGLSNPEIANELVVSVNTIKTQVQSIYYKLGVNSRQEAREAARKLRLV